MARGSGLRKTSDMTPEELREFSRKGGKASVIAKKKQKTLREFAHLVLAQRPRKSLKKFLQDNLPDVDPDDLTYKAAMVFGMVKSAIDGNTKAFKIIQQTIGEEPKSDSRAEDKLDEYFEKLEGAFKDDKSR